MVLSYLGDQQQWSELTLDRILTRAPEHPLTHRPLDFQSAKSSYQKTAKIPAKFKREDLDRGFCSSGLWSYSRHPNFAAEQSCWVLLYVWGCFESGTLYNWTVAGAISYLLLFQGSTWLTEAITAGKYPEYKTYQKHVPKFVPGPLAMLSGPADMNAISTNGTKKQK